MVSSSTSPLSETRPDKLDRAAFSVGTLDEQTSEYVASWRARPVEDRISAVQFMRVVMYGQDAATGRLQRLLQISE
jgi:hypothetical protein